ASSFTNAKIAANAAVALTKLAPLTASRALVTNASGVITTSSVTATQLSQLFGVTSLIQSQLNALSSRIDGLTFMPEGSFIYSGYIANGGSGSDSLPAGWSVSSPTDPARWRITHGMSLASPA